MMQEDGTKGRRGAGDVLAREGDLVMRRMRADAEDVARIVDWRARPHVHEFWDPDDPPPDTAQVEREYLPSTRPDSPTIGCIVELGDRPIGYIQLYPWTVDAAEAQELGISIGPDSWGLDVFVGEEDLVDRGVGTRIVRLACEHMERDRGATEVVLLTEVLNARAVRAYEKAGFVKDHRVRDFDTRDGERVQSWVMRRPPGAPS